MASAMWSIGAPLPPLDAERARGFSTAVVLMTHARSPADVGAALGLGLSSGTPAGREWTASVGGEAQAMAGIQQAKALLRVNSRDHLLMVGYTVATAGAAVMLSMLAAVPVSRSGSESPARRMLASCSWVVSDRVMMVTLTCICVAAVLDVAETAICSTFLQYRAVPAAVAAWRRLSPANALAMPEACSDWKALCDGGLAGTTDAARKLPALARSSDDALFGWLFVAGRCRSLAFAGAWGALGLRLLAAAATEVPRGRAARVDRRLARCGWTVALVSKARRWIPAALMLGGAALLLAGASVSLAERSFPGHLGGAGVAISNAGDTWAEAGILVASGGLALVCVASLLVWWQATSARATGGEGPELVDVT
ncbi:hypothetical protein FNF31_01237 [Cafeteria roenbergensis]|uniref:Uncharacterized protein n=1 Tax=Cafeteria roenbergensis TaxID=33653 RepID=A0A5A8DN78_CAFRO|nr:hypothetical protein FNF31_01237 [Cafeteria roenbergensis]KAA0169472.1 hypothetical protein FNF28_02084 [Cafeteria roenbergensis]